VSQPTKSSGVAVSDECKSKFEDVKKGKKYRYVVYYIMDEKTIQVESLGTRRPAGADKKIRFLVDLPNLTKVLGLYKVLVLSKF